MKAFLAALCFFLVSCNIQPGGDGPASSREASAPAPRSPSISAAPSAPKPRTTRPTKILPPPSPPPSRIDVAGEPWPAPARGIERLALGDLDGDDRPEVVLASHEGLWVTDGRGRVLAQAPADGHPNALLLPGPAERGTFFVAWGYGRHFPKGSSRVLAYRFAGGRLTSESVLVRESQRPAVSGLAWGTWKGQRGLVIGVYRDKYEVDLVFGARRGAVWRQDPVATVRMANAFALAPLRTRGIDDLAVGRLYGDARGTLGDAFVLEASGTRVPISIQGGLRALAAVDMDGDGLAELFLGDGWAQAYRKDGRALLTQASFRGAAFRSEPVGALEGEFMVQKILAADLDGDRRPELLVLGNASLAVFRKSATGSWSKGRLAGGEPGDFVVGDLDGDGKPDLLLAYPQELRRLSRLAVP